MTPFELAWLILKEEYYYHGTSRANQAMQQGLEPKGRVRYEDNVQAPSPALFFTSDPNEARGFATQSQSRPNERPGVVRVKASRLKGSRRIPMHDGRVHFVHRKRIKPDDFELLEDKE